MGEKMTSEELSERLIEFTAMVCRLLDARWIVCALFRQPAE